MKSLHFLIGGNHITVLLHFFVSLFFDPANVCDFLSGAVRALNGKISQVFLTQELSLPKKIS